MRSHVIDKRIIKNAVKGLMISFAQVLLDKHGFTHDEAVQALKEVDYLWESIRLGNIDVSDVEKMLDEEYDIQFE